MNRTALVFRIKRYLEWQRSRGVMPRHIPLHYADAITLGSPRFQGIPIRVLGRRERAVFWAHYLEIQQ